MANRANRPRELLLPVGLFLLTVAALLLLLFFSNPSPRITELEPSRARPGESILVRGTNFGESRGQSRIELAGQEPTSSRYLSWSDTEIELSIPTGATSGLLYVITEGGRSNPTLFTNSESEPRAQGELRTAPQLRSLDPVEVTVGEPVTLYGSGFGRRRADSSVFFTPLEGEAPTLRVDAATGGYISWGDEEVTVRVPTGAGSGPVRLVTRRGSDLSELLTVARPAGEVRYDNRREWALRQEVSLHSFAGETAGHIHLWLPDVQSSPAQRRVQLLNESHPPAVRFQEQARLYRVEPPRTEGSEEEPPPEEIRLARTFLFERYEVSAEVNPAAVPVEYEVDSAFLRRYTRREGRLRMEEEAIVAFAANSVGQVRNRYEQGSWIYRETLRVLEPDPDGTTDPLEALEGGSASADGYASLMVAALRTVGIPAREVAGVLFLDGVRSVRHRWVEFYLPEFGWFPADPALGDELFSDQLPPRPEGTEAATFYFGALDNRRGVFSHGEIPTPSMEMRGSSKRPGSLYALQKTYEEAADAVGAYESDWPVPELIGSY